MSNITDGLFLKSLPATHGLVYWVSPTSTYLIGDEWYQASDDNTGLFPNDAFRHLSRAWELVNAYDVIMLLPGAHEAVNSDDEAVSVAVSVPYVTMSGFGRKTSLTLNADDEILNITVPGIELSFITFIAASTTKAIMNFINADGLYIHDCVFDTTVV
jgi:hypothetical protein